MITLPPSPPRIARLPRNRAGYPIPWFVAIINGEPDFRVVRERGIADAVRFHSCWLCGGPLGANAAFVLGSMCAITRVAPEPPSHRDCATYAVRACPFLTNPHMRRRTSNLPDDTVMPDGEMITRNPGVTALWLTRTWRMDPTYRLFDVGDPVTVTWWAHGREATRDEVMASIESGMPILTGAAEKDPRPRAALAQLAAMHAEALRLVPAQVKQ
jgi:hypothetical protein